MFGNDDYSQLFFEKNMHNYLFKCNFMLCIIYLCIFDIQFSCFSGIIVANGFKNMLTFRNFKASLTKPLPMQLSRCGPKTHVANDEVVLDAAYPYWPVNLFCAALYKQVLDRERETYTVQAMLHNINSYMGSYWGQLGLMYNAHDHYTYEYVYLRLENFSLLSSIRVVFIYCLQLGCFLIFPQIQP